MKNVFKFSVYSLLFIATLMVTSCQEEFEELPIQDEQQTIMASSTTAKLIENTSTNDGSFDNIVDGASCFALQFPYTVEVNGIQITIDSREDLHLIEQIFDELEDDIDLLEIVFPITITYADYSPLVIKNKEELRELAAECVEGGGDDDIECIDFVYPITLFTFDINEVETGTVTVNSDEEMRIFFKGLDDDDLISIQFPVELELYDGTKITVYSNAELALAIENAKEACDEDDDNDYNDDDFTLDRFNNLIVECPWLVKEVVRDEVAQTDQYFEYLMNFKKEGNAVTVRDRMGNVLEGTWTTRMTDRGVLINLQFEFLVDFNLEWFVYEIEEGKIKLYTEGGNRIILKSACDIFNDDPTTLREILKECAWVIKKVKNNGEEIDRLLGYKFTFGANAEITLSNGVNTSTGTWEITTNTQGQLVMAITMGDEPGVSFEWLLRDLNNKRLKFDIEGTAYELVLERHCNDNNEDGDVMGIRDYLMDGTWRMAQFVSNGNDSTAGYDEFDYVFSSNNALSVEVNADPIADGFWRIIRDSEGQLRCYLNFGEGNNFIVLTNDWRIVEVSSTRIELRKENTGGAEDILVFEK